MFLIFILVLFLLLFPLDVLAQPILRTHLISLFLVSSALALLHFHFFFFDFHVLYLYLVILFLTFLSVTGHHFSDIGIFTSEIYVLPFLADDLLDLFMRSRRESFVYLRAQVLEEGFIGYF